MGLEFSVTPAVLIPRQDTETLVETVLSYAKDKPGASLVDVCTGSGCIAVSLFYKLTILFYLLFQFHNLSAI